MKTGDTVRDGQGRSFQIGQILGRGLWGKTYAVREEGGGPEWALKVPLSTAELPEGAAHLAPVCRDILLEQGRLLAQHPLPFLAPIESSFTTAAGVPVLLLPRQGHNLERKLSSGCSLEELTALCIQVTTALRDLSELLPSHGNLTPANVLIDERGRVRLMDPLTDTARRHVDELRRLSGAQRPYLPPELQTTGGQHAGLPGDIYAVAMILYWGVLASAEGSTRLPEAPLKGLDKAQLVALKDRVHNRLKDEGANPRFHTRLSDRAAALLNRALSEPTAPSPPYRFLNLDEFQRRLQKLHALIHPKVEHVGKILLERPPGNDSFDTDEDVVFSCTIGCSSGVETHEEIACGLAMFDRESDERIRNIACAYTVNSHPSGRLRFGFRVSDLLPGSYLIRVAFAIRESGDEPIVAEGRFERRAAPGYVPPRIEPERRPIPLERPGAEPVTQTHESPQPLTAEEHAAATPPPTRPAPVQELHPPEHRLASADRGSMADSASVSAGSTSRPQVQLTEPRARVAPVIMPGPDAAGDEFDAQLQYEGAGPWTELPLPDPTRSSLSTTGEDLYSDTPRPEEDDDDLGLPGPIGGAIERLLELIRGDAYVMFIGGGAVIILLLIIILFALR